MSQIPTPNDVAASMAPLVLLVWDAPNVDMTLSNIIGRRPSPATRPRYERVAKWLVAQAEDSDVQAAVFTNYTEGTSGSIRGWLAAIQAIGFDVFIKPKHDSNDDIDDDMLTHIRHMHAGRRLTRLVVVSGDGKAFESELQALATSGVIVTVVSFTEVASWALKSPSLTFLDLEEIPGAFIQPLARIRLEHLPAAGAWLRATGDLRANLDLPDDPPLDAAAA